jgi:protease-4
MVPPSPPKERSSFFGGLPMVVLILGLLAIASCQYSFSSILDRAGAVARDKTLGSPGIAVLAVKGEIYDTEWAVDAVKRFQANPNVRALVLRVDSPGGLVAPCQELYQALRAFDRPKVVSMGSLAASGGYYIAVTGDVIYANPGTITGSIGVIMEAIEFSSAMEKIGVRSEVIKSGAFKDSGSPFRTMREDEREALQGMVMNVYERFVQDVLAGRGKMTEEAVRALADGRVFSGEEAQALGLVDRLGGYEDALAHAVERAGLPKGEEPPMLYEDGQTGLLGQLVGGSLDFLKPVGGLSPGLTMKFIYHPGL